MYKILLDTCFKEAPMPIDCSCNPYSYPDFLPCKHSTETNNAVSQWLPHIRNFYDVKEKAENKVLQQAIEAEIGHTTNYIDPIKEKIAKHQNNLYYWITVTPGNAPFGKRELTLDDFASQIEKFIHRRCCTAGIACIEQKGKYELERGLHPHAHILVRRDLNCPPTTLRKNLISSFTRFYKKNPSPQTLHFQPCPQEYIIDKIEYMRGATTKPLGPGCPAMSGGKTAPGKDICQQQDALWRADHSWPSYWKNGELPS